MPATSQQGFSCAACIRATGAVDLSCTFTDGVACASTVGSERLSTTMTAKANVADFVVITDLRLTQPSTLGKVVSALQPPNNCTPPARGNKRSHFFVGRIVKENLLLSSTPEALRGLSTHGTTDPGGVWHPVHGKECLTILLGTYAENGQCNPHGRRTHCIRYISLLVTAATPD